MSNVSEDKPRESISASPETDALADYYKKYGITGPLAYGGMCSHARQLERERDAARSASAPSMEELREKIGQAAYEWQQYVDTDHAPINLVSFMEQQFDAALSATTPAQEKP